MKKTTAAFLSTSLMALAILSGCGRVPASMPGTTGTGKTTTRSPLQSTVQQPVPQTGAVPGAAAGAAGNAQAIMAAVRQAQATQQGFSGTIDVWEKGPDGKSGSEEIQAYWKRPSTLRINIVKGDSSSQGAQVLWTGGSSMQVKPSYLPFAVSIGITDDRVISRNKWTVKETDLSCVLSVILDPSTQVTLVGPQVVDGKSVTLLNVKSPKSPKGVTQEQIGIDAATSLPVVRLMYMNNTLAYKLVAKSFKTGAPSADKLTI